MTAQARPVEGPAFPPLVKLLALSLVAAMLVWGARVADRMFAVDWTFPNALVVLTGIAMVLWCASWIVRSRTCVDATHIRQTWMWHKQVALADVTQARMVGVPGLSWLVAPRLVVRARGRGLLVFHAADRRVLAAFASLCLGSIPR
jgi:hypothetical protein